MEVVERAEPPDCAQSVEAWRLTAEEWLGPLGNRSHPAHLATVERLHELVTRAARHQVAHTPLGGHRLDHGRIDEIVATAADEATAAVLARLDTFEGRSRFTTWAYKFGILHAAVELRRATWREREISLDLVAAPLDRGASPEQLVEAGDLSAAVGRALDTVLTAHQRRVALALIVQEVPVDVLAVRFGTTRNALYKTLHDARVRLRAELRDRGYLLAAAAEEADR
jgi:RNA polymerase sigma-70 factor (ECF subfamily)